MPKVNPKEDRGPYVEHSNGELFYFLDPVFNVRNLAWACSGQQRFGAQPKIEYSGLHHMLLVARIALYFKGNVREALAHDLHEGTGLGDMPTPIKKLLPDYRKLERFIYKKMAAALEIPPTMSVLTKKCDRLALFLEADVLMRSRGKNYDDYEKSLLDVKTLKQAGIMPRYGSRQEVYQEWLRWWQKSNDHIV